MGIWMRLTAHGVRPARVLNLGRPPEQFCSIAEIAKAFAISQNHLMKVLNELLDGVLWSASVAGKAVSSLRVHLPMQLRCARPAQRGRVRLGRLRKLRHRFGPRPHQRVGRGLAGFPHRVQRLSQADFLSPKGDVSHPLHGIAA